jgi:hypothetical protein
MLSLESMKESRPPKSGGMRSHDCADLFKGAERLERAAVS